MRGTSVPGLLSLGRQVLEKALGHLSGKRREPFLLVDATCGNGHDTLFLAEALDKFGIAGRVLAFDVQEQALLNARARIAEATLQERVEFMLKGHEFMREYIPEGGSVAAAMFNLGYLPGSDKQVATGAQTTLAALEGLSRSTARGGVTSVHVYTGHPGGSNEALALEAWFSKLSGREWTVARYEICNKTRNREILYLAEKL